MSLGGHAGRLQRLVADLEGALHEVHHHPVELVGAERLLEVEHLPLGRLADALHVDGGLAVAPHVDLGLLAGLLEHLQAELVLAQVDAVLGQEVLGQPGHDPVVEVVAAQVGVAGGGDDLEDVAPDLQDGDVEGAAAQVVDADALGDVLAEAVGERRRGGLVDDAQHLEAGDAPGVLGGLALVVVEVGGAGDHRLAHLAAQRRLGDGLHLLQHQRRHLGDGEHPLADLRPAPSCWAPRRSCRASPPGPSSPRRRRRTGR